MKKYDIHNPLHLSTKQKPIQLYSYHADLAIT